MQLDAEYNKNSKKMQVDATKNLNKILETYLYEEPNQSYMNISINDEDRINYDEIYMSDISLDETYYSQNESLNYPNYENHNENSSNICDIAKNCYPEIVNGNYCVSDPKLSDVTFSIQNDINNEAHKTIMCDGGEKIEEKEKKKNAVRCRI